MANGSGFPLTAAQLIANWAETLFYGIYLATCAFAARTLLLTGNGRDERWLRFDEIRWLMMFFAVSFFIVLTFDISIGIYHNYAAFIVAAGSEGALNHFLNLADWVNVARSVTQCLAMVLGDFILVYRCWVVYGRRWLIIFPSLILYLATLATSVRFVQVEVAPATTKDAALSDSHEATAWLITIFGLATGQNILSTGLLIYRIWRVDHDLERYVGNSDTKGKHQPRHLRKVIIVLAESGAFYTLTVLLSVILGSLKSAGLYPVGDVALQATGIVFNVILVRASKVRDRQFTTYNGDMSSFHANPQSENVTMRTTAHTDIEGSVTAVGNDGHSKMSRNTFGILSQTTMASKPGH